MPQPTLPAPRSPDFMARLLERDPVPGMVSAVGIDFLGQYLQDRGVDRREVISEADLLLSHRHAGRFPAEAFCQLLLKAAKRLEDPYLGLHMGQAATLSILGAVGYVFMACENLGMVMLHLQRYHRLLHDINPMHPPYISDGNLVLEWGIAQGRPGPVFGELAITGLVKLARELCRDPLDAVAIDFVNPEPPDTTPYTRFFRCPIRFAQPLTRVVVPLSALQAPLKRPDPTLLLLMSPQVDAALSHLPADADLASSTRRIIANLTPGGIPELEQVALELSMTPKTLYRRLIAQGINFRQLREEVLRQLAEEGLRDPRRTLVEVGDSLGYTEQSAFTRAFKRWTGLTPAQWRARQEAALPSPSH